MKLLKTYEMHIDSINFDENSELLRQYGYKIGEYIKIKDDILQIVAINTNDNAQPFKIKNHTGEYWFSGSLFRYPTKEELDEYLMKKDSDKYNL